MRSLKTILFSSSLMMLNDVLASDSVLDTNSTVKEQHPVTVTSNLETTLTKLRGFKTLKQRINEIETSHNLLMRQIINKVNILFDGCKEIINDQNLSERMTSLSMERVEDLVDGQQLSDQAKLRLQTLKETIIKVEKKDAQIQKIFDQTTDVARLKNELIVLQLEQSESKDREEIINAHDQSVMTFEETKKQISEIMLLKMNKVQLQTRADEISEQKRQVKSDLDKMQSIAQKLVDYNNSADAIHHGIEKDLDFLNESAD